ncbi:MAG: sporulation integral membrane protein YtvI [Clostridiaceae bacterium]|nr:sporulation integral membrane protein YtvI [Clostridiaceae bacterium]
MLTENSKIKNSLRSLVIILGILVLVYIGISYCFIFFAPFIIAIILSSINEPIIVFLLKKFRIPRSTAAVISLIITVCVAALVITLIVMKVYYELIKLKGSLPQYIEAVSTLLTGYYDRASLFYYNLPENISSAFGSNLVKILPKVEGVISGLASSILESLTSIPKLALFITVTLLSSYFISSDRHTIINFLYRQFPKRYKKNISGIKSDTVSAILGYIKAQLILVSITFVEATLGFMIIGADYAVLMGFLTAMSDAVPVLGTNMIFLPWILWSLITGNFNMALGLTVVYILGIIIRQILEPRLVAYQTGLHPLAALIFMYTGFLIFGFSGLFIGPILLIFIKSLQSTGIISIWND